MNSLDTNKIPLLDIDGDGDGDGEAALGDEAVDDETAFTGDEAATTGDEWLTAGDERLVGGDEWLTGGDEWLTGGDECLTGGGEWLTAGDEGVMAGDFAEDGEVVGDSTGGETGVDAAGVDTSQLGSIGTLQILGMARAFVSSSTNPISRLLSNAEQRHLGL